MEWYMELDNRVFTILKTKLNKKLKTEYADLYITDSDINSSVPSFPNVYFHVLGGIEVGKDLEQTSVNGILFTVQVEVLSKKQADTKLVMSEVLSIFKGMAFEIVTMPEFNNQDNVYRQVARLRRVIGQNDVPSLK